MPYAARAKNFCCQLASTVTESLLPAPQFCVVSPLHFMLQSVEGADVADAVLPHQHSLLYSVPAYL